jgi:eukaryotic-like serine/threonine-protein kinase
MPSTARDAYHQRMSHDRRSLEEVCRAEAPLPWRDALAIVAALARVLGEHHARGVVQRHLRADRIYVTPQVDGAVMPVVTIDALAPDDVGVMDEPDEPPPSGHGEFLDHLNARVHRPQGFAGGVRYTTPWDCYSPEQMMGKHDIDVRSDIYGLGVIAYRLLAGRLPFADAMDAPISLLRAQLKQIPPAPSVVRPDAGIPRSVDALVLACLARDRNVRLSDTGAVARAIADALG